MGTNQFRMLYSAKAKRRDYPKLSFGTIIKTKINYHMYPMQKKKCRAMYMLVIVERINISCNHR